MCKFRDLRADEIECRVQSARKNGLVLLLYKDARVDMNILDETVGADNWQNRFYEHKGILFCSLGINTNYEKPELPDRWIWKDDAGVESNTEAEKGNASDARKRAGFAWGIGRELYTSPFIWIPAENCNLEDGKNGSKQCYDKFIVQSITIENKQITALEIFNKTKKCSAYSLGKNGDKNGDKNGGNNAPRNTVMPPEVLTYEKALETKLAFGDYEGQTLKEIYKSDREYIKWLYENDNVSDYIKAAIAIINAEIRKANAK